jgi:hypothetical protein
MMGVRTLSQVSGHDIQQRYGFSLVNGLIQQIASPIDVPARFGRQRSRAKGDILPRSQRFQFGTDLFCLDPPPLTAAQLRQNFQPEGIELYHGHWKV